MSSQNITLSETMTAYPITMSIDLYSSMNEWRSMSSQNTYVLRSL